MNTSMSNTHAQSMSREDKTKLSNTERMLLLLPMAGGLVFGLGPSTPDSKPKPRSPKDQGPKSKVVQKGLESLLVPPAAGIYARST